MQTKVCPFSVDINVQTVSSILPAPEHDNMPFTGVVSGSCKVGPHTEPAYDAEVRALEAQKRDAEERNVLWRFKDDHDFDADGEIDPDYVASQKSADRTDDQFVPIGLRQDDGTIVPIPEEMHGKAMHVDSYAKGSEEAHFIGAFTTVPRDIEALVRKSAARSYYYGRALISPCTEPTLRGCA